MAGTTYRARFIEFQLRFRVALVTSFTGRELLSRESQRDAGAVLVYDGDCPVCSAYVAYLRLQQSVGRVELVNARLDAQLRQRMAAEGLDLDEGMVLIYGGETYHGADCVHMLALLSTPLGIFNRLNAALFRRHRIARFLYPILRAGRNFLLRLLGRTKLNAKS